MKKKQLIITVCIAGVLQLSPAYGQTQESGNKEKRDKREVITDKADKEKADKAGVRAQRQRNRAALRASADNAFGPVIGTERFFGWQVQGPGGNKIGVIKDLVVDLESGRILYGVVDEAGIAGNHAVAPGAFKTVDESQKLIMAEFGGKVLNDAPKVSRSRQDYASQDFVGNVYRFYGEKPWFEQKAGAPTGRPDFGNVHRVSDLVGMSVKNVTGEQFAEVQNVLVDLPDARVAFVMLSTKDRGRGQEWIAVPPMALTLSEGGKTLTTNLEGEKLNNAPRLARGDEMQRLDDPSYAAEVYRYYGKDTYWQK